MGRRKGEPKDSVMVRMTPACRNKVEEIKKMQPIIICCATGELSKWAYNFLQKQGLKEVHNGGNWDTVAFLIQKFKNN